MASLQRVGDNSAPDPHISFNLELLGYEKFADGKVAKDWLDVSIWLVLLGLTIKFPGQKTVSVDELKYFIEWLRELSKNPRGVHTFQTFHEPLFSMTAENFTGETFDIKALISSYGAAPGFYSEDEGVSVQFTISRDSISGFANELEREFSDLQGNKRNG